MTGQLADLPWSREDLAGGVLDAVGDLAFVADRSGGLVWWNERLPAVTGYAGAELGGMDALDLVAPDDRDRARAAIEAVLGGENRTAAVDLVAGDGERVAYDLAAAPLADDGGRVRAVAAVAREADRRVVGRSDGDGTDADRAGDRAEPVFEGAHDGLYRLDADGRFLWVNDAFVEMTGYARDEILGENVADFLAPGVVESYLEAIGTLLSDEGREVVTLENAIETADGETLHVEDKLLLSPGDGFEGTLGVLREVTERRELEAALREEKELVERLFDASPAGITVVDADGTIVRANETTEEILRLERSDIVGRRYDAPEWEIFDEDGEPIPSEDLPVARVLATGEPVTGYEHGIRVDGEEVWLSVNSAPLFDEDGGVGRVVSTIREFTDRREREREFRARNDELATLDRINGLIEEVIRGLVRAASREEIEETVCRRLTASDLYGTAYVAEREPGGDGVVPRVGAGTDDGFLDRIAGMAPETTGSGGAMRALDTGEVHVVQDLETDPSVPEPIRELSLARGDRSCIVVPLVYRETVYGVLILNADERAAFTDRQVTAFEVLGETVGFAIAAIQNRKLLYANSVVELEFRMDDTASVFPRLSGELSCAFDLESAAPLTDDTVVMYVSVSGVDAGRAAEATAAREVVDSARVVDGEVGLLETVLSTTPVATLVEAGGVVREGNATDGRAHVVSEFPAGTDTRSVVERMRAAHGAELTAKRQVERPVRTLQEYRRLLNEQLTEKQRSVLRAAYYGGYFDWPRGSTVEELAEPMDITSATLHYHLRGALRGLLASFLDDG